MVSHTWLRAQNEERPHESLGRVPPLTVLPRSDGESLQTGAGFGGQCASHGASYRSSRCRAAAP